MNMSFYTGAVGAYMQNQRMNVQANNIANVNNYGYKAERATFHHLMYGNVTGIDDEQLPKGTGTKMVKASVDYETGGYTETGFTFDFAIKGDGFFALYDPSNGEILAMCTTPFLNPEDTSTVTPEHSPTVIRSYFDRTSRFISFKNSCTRGPLAQPGSP